MFAPPLFAQQSYGEFERDLNLSDSQKAQADGIKRRYIGEWRSLNDESARKRLELRQLDRGRPGQRERAERLQRDLDRIEASRQRLFHQYRGEVSTVFNDEQRGRFNRFTWQENRRAARLIRPGPELPGPAYAPPPGHAYGPGGPQRYGYEPPGHMYAPGPRYVPFGASRAAPRQGFHGR
ncbi:MAG: Spy/CpxP family protein refolding chaperone [Syntrophorhabdales bacterium]|jgi:hypothetical protein